MCSISSSLIKAHYPVTRLKQVFPLTCTTEARKVMQMRPEMR
jgi:hypothetical protein